MSEVVQIVRSVMSIDSVKRRKQVAMTIVPESGGTVLNIPYAPRAVDHSDLGGSFVSINRPGLPEITVFQNRLTPKMSFSVIVADKRVSVGGSTTVVNAINVINTLKSFAESGKRLRISYGALESGLWYLIDLSLSSIRRSPYTDEITQADVSMSFARAEEVVVNTGPVTGGVQPPAPPVATPSPAKTATKTYVVKKGDTLWAISIRYYGTGTKWQRIADVNRIKDPRKLQIGTKLTIP